MDTCFYRFAPKTPNFYRTPTLCARALYMAPSRARGIARGVARRRGRPPDVQVPRPSHGSHRRRAQPDRLVHRQPSFASSRALPQAQRHLPVRRAPSRGALTPRQMSAARRWPCLRRRGRLDRRSRRRGRADWPALRCGERGRC